MGFDFWFATCLPPASGIGVLLVGHRRDLWLVALLLLLFSLVRFVMTGGLLLTLLLGLFFDCWRWTCRVTQSVQRTPLWPASWLPAIDKIRRSKSIEVQRIWEVYDDRLQFMSWQDAQWLNESLDDDDVFSCMACLVWCC